MRNLGGQKWWSDRRTDTDRVMESGIRESKLVMEMPRILKSSPPSLHTVLADVDKIRPNSILIQN